MQQALTRARRSLARSLRHLAARCAGASVVLALAAALAPANAAITETITYIHNDAAGTPVAATDETGAVLWRQVSLPYGERDIPAVSAQEEPTGFTGKRIDETTGLLYFNARDYDPSIGRFTGIDPVGFRPDSVQSFNRYAYANNNPYRYVDPSGEVPIVLAFWAVKAAWTAYDTYKTVRAVRAAGAVSTGAVAELAAGAVAGPAGKAALKGGRWLRRVFKSGCCFVAGTTVLTPDGPRPIESLNVGDMVLAHDVETGETAAKRVTQLHVREVGPIYAVQVSRAEVTDRDSSETFHVTAEHPFWMADEQQWLTAGELRAGDVLTSESGERLVVNSHSLTAREDTTYNITVEDFATYFVGDSRVLVHNCSVRSSAAKKRGRSSNHHRELPDADGRPHSVFRTDEKGQVTSYETYNYPSPGKGKRVDLTGAAHNGVPTPHVTDTIKHVNPSDSRKFGFSEGPTRPASSGEIPK